MGHFGTCGGQVIGGELIVVCGIEVLGSVGVVLGTVGAVVVPGPGSGVGSGGGGAKVGTTPGVVVVVPESALVAGGLAAGASVSRGRDPVAPAGLAGALPPAPCGVASKGSGCGPRGAVVVVVVLVAGTTVVGRSRMVVVVEAIVVSWAATCWGPLPDDRFGRPPATIRPTIAPTARTAAMTQLRRRVSRHGAGDDAQPRLVLGRHRPMADRHR